MSTTLKPKLAAGTRDGSAATDTTGTTRRQTYDDRKKRLNVSKAFLAPSESGSVVSSSFMQNKQVMLEPTYRLKPHEEKMFKAHKISSVLQEILDSRLAHVTYNAEQCARISQDLATVIKGRVREMDFPRYKIVATVTIGEYNGQGVKMASRFLWNTNTDDFATASFVNKSIYAVAAVYGLYLD